MVILLAIVLGVDGYLVFGKIFDSKQENVDNVQDTNKNDKSESKIMSDQEIDKIGRLLFERTSFRQDGIELVFYDKNILTYNDLNNEIRLSIAWNLMSKNLIELSPYISYSDDESSYFGEMYYPDNCIGVNGNICYSRKTSLEN